MAAAQVTRCSSLSPPWPPRISLGGARTGSEPCERRGRLRAARRSVRAVVPPLPPAPRNHHGAPSRTATSSLTGIFGMLLCRGTPSTALPIATRALRPKPSRQVRACCSRGCAGCGAQAAQDGAHQMQPQHSLGNVRLVGGNVAACAMDMLHSHLPLHRLTSGAGAARRHGRGPGPGALELAAHITSAAEATPPWPLRSLP
jgi:hypothetical protein